MGKQIGNEMAKLHISLPFRIISSIKAKSSSLELLLLVLSPKISPSGYRQEEKSQRFVKAVTFDPPQRVSSHSSFQNPRTLLRLDHCTIHINSCQNTENSSH